MAISLGKGGVFLDKQIQNNGIVGIRRAPVGMYLKNKQILLAAEVFHRQRERRLAKGFISSHRSTCAFWFSKRCIFYKFHLRTKLNIQSIILFSKQNPKTSGIEKNLSTQTVPFTSAFVNR
ncbi:hypothetical protein ACROYT_G038897 [Oculina patagonica]